ncbi:MAG: aspartyl-phosphate phosphatase Spo0E family protein [Bacillota bacterium]|nr:aspartyl-phosphate phosphatase Spo0E family protein [Bacillota bacterium]
MMVPVEKATYEKIEEQMNSLRIQLTLLVNNYGINHSCVIKCSQELDKYIFQIQTFNQCSHS